MKRSVALVLALASLATLGTSQDAEANVRLTRRGDGRVVIFNDIGSGWRVSGRAPSDAFLVARKSAPTPFDETIHTCSRAHGIDPGLVKSVMLIESNFNPRALSRKGARGLMQLMPATARRFGVTNAFDPHENIRGGTAYLAWLLGNFNGNVHLALAGYNAGEGAVARYGGVPPYAETQEYVRRGMLVYSGSGSSGALLEGGFMGQGIAPLVVPRSVEAAVRMPAVRVRSVPVRLSSGTNGGRMLSNAGSYHRPKPLLGRVQP